MTGPGKKRSNFAFKRLNDFRWNNVEQIVNHPLRQRIIDKEAGQGKQEDQKRKYYEDDAIGDVAGVGKPSSS